MYKAIDKETKKVVALKRIIMHNEKHDGFPLTSIREIATLRQIDHPNCVKMLNVVVGHRRDGNDSSKDSVCVCVFGGDSCI